MHGDCAFDPPLQANNGPYGDGVACLDCPVAMCLSLDQRKLLFSDMFNHRLRELNLAAREGHSSSATRRVVTISGGAVYEPAGRQEGEQSPH